MVKTSIDRQELISEITDLRQRVTELKKKETELRYSEEKQQIVFESANDILVTLDRKGKILDVNKKLKDIGGYEREEIQGKNIRSLTKMVTKKSMPIVLSNFLKIMAGMVISPFEAKMIRKDGELATFEINAVALRKGSKITGSLAILRDITERKQNEENLRNLSEVVKQSPLYIAITDVEGKIEYVNPAFSGVTGYSLGEVMGKNPRILQSGETPRSVYEDLWKTISAGKTWRGEFKNKKKNGILYWESATISPSKNEHDVITHYVAVKKDITERKEIENELRESKERYHDLIHNANEMIQSVNPDGSFIFVNPAWLQTLDYTEEDLPSLNMFNIIHPESLTHCKEMFARVMAGENASDISATFVTKNGSKILVEGNASPRFLGDRVIATQGIFRDVTERRQAEKKLKLASLDTIHRLALAAEYKDEGTGAHIQRMSEYSAAIARKMGLDDSQVEDILYAAPMHDIGKIGIPDHILLKSGKLTENEWEIMKKHTLIGAEILRGSDAEFIQLAEIIALTHHEKWDGSGYPQGLKGSEIPLAGRIAAIADVFDALMSRRPYKDPLPINESLEIIEQSRGSHFDPDVVDAFLDILDTILSIRDRYSDEQESKLLRMSAGVR